MYIVYRGGEIGLAVSRTKLFAISSSRVSHPLVTVQLCCPASGGVNVGGDDVGAAGRRADQDRVRQSRVVPPQARRGASRRVWCSGRSGRSVRKVREVGLKKSAGETERGPRGASRREPSCRSQRNGCRASRRSCPSAGQMLVGDGLLVRQLGRRRTRRRGASTMPPSQKRGRRKETPPRVVTPVLPCQHGVETACASLQRALREP